MVAVFDHKTQKLSPHANVSTMAMSSLAAVTSIHLPPGRVSDASVQDRDASAESSLSQSSFNERYSDPSADRGGSFSSEDGSSDETLSYTDDSSTLDMDFIHEKQRILHRAALALWHQEDEYNATAARQDQSPEEPAIWIEAKDILKELNATSKTSRKRKADDEEEEDEDAPPLPKSVTLHKRKALVSNPRDLSIDLRQVQRQSSKLFDQIARSEPVSSTKNLPLSLFSEGQWMARALVSSRSPSAEQVRPWKIWQDPWTLSVGLVPPYRWTNEMLDLSQALELCDQARIVCQSTPPFAIVHVNKAFLQLSHVESDEVIGFPVETIVRNVHGDDEYWSGELLGDAKPCQIRVVPVVDRSNQSRQTRYPRLSHILVVVTSKTL